MRFEEHQVAPRPKSLMRCKCAVLECKQVDARDPSQGYQVRFGFTFGELLAQMQGCLVESIGGLKYLDFVYIKGYLDTTGSIKCFDVRSLERCLPWENLELPASVAFPISLCADANAAHYLKSCIHSQTIPHYKEFIWRVLLQSRVLAGFLNNPASYSYHHSFPSGLLWHSLQVAQATQRMIDCFEPNLPLKMRELAFVGGLFHDVAKAVTLNHRGVKTPLGRLVDHASLTTEICGPALSWLEEREPDAAHLLRHIWTASSPGSRYGVQPMNSLARYVRDADGQSALVSGQWQSHRNQPPQPGFSKLGMNHYWQPDLLAESP